MVATSFRNEMVDLVRRRHCVNHPLTEAWASGKLTREQLGLWAVEHYHYTRDLWRFIGRPLPNCAVAAGPAVELDNMADAAHPPAVHNDQLTDFSAARGRDPQRASQADPLPTTKA